MTLVHKRSDFQSKVEIRGSTLSAYDVRVRAGIELAGKKEELTPEYVSSLSNYDESDKAALNEVLFMNDDVKKQEDDDIKSGLERLTFKENKHIPNVPDDVIAKGCEDKYQHIEPDDYDIKDIKSSFPSLDESTIVALMKRSNFDLRPGSMMIVCKFVCYIISQHTQILINLIFCLQWEITLLAIGMMMSCKNLLKPSSIIWHLTN